MTKRFFVPINHRKDSMKLLIKLTTFVVVCALLFQLACGSANFARDLRLALAVSGPLVESLNLGGKRSAVIADFTDLGNGAATLSDDIKACAAVKACELNAVQKFDGTFETVINRGDFGLSPRLGTIEGILRGIIAAAKVYYGAPSNSRAAVNPGNQEKIIKAKIDELKKAMQP